MAENVEDDKSDFESVTSSQKSFLNNCPFADPGARPTKSTDSDNTEVIGNQMSPAAVKTPILSFSSSTSLDSINDDVFRTPPENASLSSAADSEPRVRVSEFKPRGVASKSKSPSSTPKTTPILENFRVSEITPSKLKSPSSTPVLEIKPLGEASELKSPSSTPKKTPALQNVKVSKIKPRGEASKLKSPSSTPKSPSSVRVPEKHCESDSPSPIAIASVSVLEKQPVSANTEVMKSPDKVIKITKVDSDGSVIPFKEIIEALLRNSGKNLNEKDENFSYVEILKKCGLKFP